MNRSRETLWHVAEAANRIGIRRRGLLPTAPVNAPEQPPGVYAFRAADRGHAWKLFDAQYAMPGVRYDIWRIDPAGLAVTDDLAWEGEAVVVDDVVPPGRLSLAATDLLQGAELDR
jgi:hypothetical protein